MEYDARGWPILQGAPAYPGQAGHTARRLPSFRGDRLFPEGFGVGYGQRQAEARARLAQGLVSDFPPPPHSPAWEMHDDPTVKDWTL